MPPNRNPAAPFPVPQSASTIHLHRTLNQIKAMGCMAGVVLNPGTPLSQIEYVLSEVPIAGLGPTRVGLA